MAHGRIDAAGSYVVFQNLIGPPRAIRGLKPAAAFALIVERCDYKPIWRADGEQIVLEFEQHDGTRAPVSFRRRIEYGFEFDKEFVMGAVFENGLRGWLAMPSDTYSIVHSIAEQDLRNPSGSWRWLGTTSVSR